MVTATTNKPPFFFCAPGNKDDCPEEVKKTFSGSDISVPWPVGTQLRIKILAGEKYHPVFYHIIETTSKLWVDGVRLGLQWVPDNEDAHIRISFNPKVPNWSATGARALQYDRGKSTMNFNFAGWTEYHAIYSHAQVERIAGHLFGHALGLPHAQLKWSSDWNDAGLQHRYGQFFASIIKSDKGIANLSNPQSIMQFDRLAVLCSGSSSDDRHGGQTIDEETREYLRSLYPPEMEVYCRNDVQKQDQAETVRTPRTGAVITGLTKIDIGNDQNFRLRNELSNTKKGSSFDHWLHTWDNTKMYDAKCDVLAFDPKDTRGDALFVQQKGRLLGMVSKSIAFRRSYKKMPNVVCFLATVDLEKGFNVRARVVVDQIEKNGFTLSMGAWEDTPWYEMAAWCFIHEQDEWSIRSGTWESPYRDPSTGKMDQGWLNFNPPMFAKPRYMLRGFNYLDLPFRANQRVRFDLPRWDEKGVEGQFSTWENESSYYQVKGSFVAVL